MKHRRGIDFSFPSHLAMAREIVTEGVYPTLAAYPEWYIFGGHCVRCKHEAWLDRWELQRAFGKDRLLRQLQGYLRCLACNNKGNNLFIVGKMPR